MYKFNKVLRRAEDQFLKSKFDNDQVYFLDLHEKKLGHLDVSKWKSAKDWKKYKADNDIGHDVIIFVDDVPLDDTKATKKAIEHALIWAYTVFEGD